MIEAGEKMLADIQGEPMMSTPAAWIREMILEGRYNQ